MAEISQFEIDMLNVGAADAILIHAFVRSSLGSDNEYVVLVDAGNEGDGEAIMTHINRYYGQKYVDLAICTHCDSDHYGGFKELIQAHKDPKSAFSIDKFWIHDPYAHVNLDDVKYVRSEPTLRERLNAAFSFSDGTSLISLIDEAGIQREEPFCGTEYSPLDIFVLGPTKEYYESLIPSFRLNLDFKSDQGDAEYPELLEGIVGTKDEFYSKTLEDAEDDLSSVNQSSVVFALAKDQDVFLFTGDAGRDALQRIISIDYQGALKNLAWLKAPHHGSKHNLSNSIISYFHPTATYISTGGYGKYANRCTVNALKKVGLSYSTYKSGSIRYDVGIGPRQGYITAQPL